MDMRRGISFERLQSLGYDQAMEQGKWNGEMYRFHLVNGKKFNVISRYVVFFISL